MHLPHKALVLIADDRKATLFINHGDAERLDLRQTIRDAFDKDLTHHSTPEIERLLSAY